MDAVAARRRSSSRRMRAITLSFPKEMNREIEAEARRQWRPVSQIVRIAWLIAQREIRRVPSHRPGA